VSPADEVLRAQRRVEMLTVQLGEAVQQLAAASRRAAGFVRADLPDVQAIIHEVAEDFGVLPLSILGSSKIAEFSDPRKVAMYLVRRLTPHGLHALGRAFNKDHGAVCHAENRVVELMSINTKFATRVARLQQQCERRLAMMPPKARAM